jgi:hypothetical protein
MKQHKPFKSTANREKKKQKKNLLHFPFRLPTSIQKTKINKSEHNTTNNYRKYYFYKMNNKI